MKKLVKYKIFNEERLNSLNESLISDFYSKISDIKGWAGNFIERLKRGLVKTIPSGPNKGKPIAMLFVPQNGSITSQFLSYNNMSISNENIDSLTEGRLEDFFKHDDEEVEDMTAEQIMHRIKTMHTLALAGKYNEPLFVYGAPGIGKTQIITGAADIIGDVDLIFMDLQFYMPEDFVGIPTAHTRRAEGEKEMDEIEAKKIRGAYRKDAGKQATGKQTLKQKLIKFFDWGEGFTRRNLPTIFPRDEGSMGKGGIIFMDEANRANKFTKNSLMNFLGEERRIENYTLPKGWIIVAAGNRYKDDPNFFDEQGKEGDPFVQRFSVVNFVPKFEDWSKWARTQNNIMPELVDWFEVEEIKQNWWHKSNPQEKSGIPWPSPRSWTQASKLLMDESDVTNTPWQKMDEDYIRSVFAAKVGKSAANQFMDYLRLVKEMPKSEIDIVLSRPMKAKFKDEWVQGKNSSLFMSLIRILLNSLGTTYDPTKIANLFVYANIHKHKENMVMVKRDIQKRFNSFDWTKIQSADLEELVKYIDSTFTDGNDPTFSKSDTPTPLNTINASVVKKAKDFGLTISNDDAEEFRALRIAEVATEAAFDSVMTKLTNRFAKP